jgi:hypothetical protein
MQDKEADMKAKISEWKSAGRQIASPCHHLRLKISVAEREGRNRKDSRIPAIIGPITKTIIKKM